MAKYDNYKVSKLSGNATKPITRTLEVLMEDGDDVPTVLMEADLLLITEAEMNEGTLRDALLDISEDETIALLIDVWTEQMSTMGNDKFRYANRLRDAVNAAQNA